MSRRGGANKEIMEAWLQEYMKPGTVTVIVYNALNYKKSGIVKQIGLKKTSPNAWNEKIYDVLQWNGCKGSFKLESGTLANVHIFHLVPKKLKLVQPLGHSGSFKNDFPLRDVAESEEFIHILGIEHDGERQEF